MIRIERRSKVLRSATVLAAPPPEGAGAARGLATEVDLRSGQRVEACYHCHKCTAGCPVVAAMEHGPDRLLRLLMLDRRDAVLDSRDIWLCAGCFTCVTRCPSGIDVAAVMDALRQLAIAEGRPAAEPDALLFHRLFLGVVKRLGRSHEAVVLGLFKLLSNAPILDDLAAGLGLFLRGKMPLLPARSTAGVEVRKIVRRGA